MKKEIITSSSSKFEALVSYGSTMWTGLFYIVLLTVCLSSVVLSDTVKGTFPGESFDDEESDGVLYSTPDDYDDYGGLVKLTTNTYDEPTTIDRSLSKFETTTDANYDFNLESSERPTSPPTLKFTTELKGGENPKNDDSCAYPRSVVRAKISKGIKPQYSEGDVVHYSCDFGYVTEASEWTSTCIRSEDTNLLEWTTPQINCIPRSCGDPGFVVNGHRIGSLFTFPNKVSFECDEGFELKGNGIRFCKTSGIWSGTLPKCEKIFCDVPENPENGKVSYTSLEYGSELVYECHKGFILRKFQTRVCSENATWSGDLPICQEAQCEPPFAPEHGTVQVVGSKSMIGSRAIYTCDGNRILVGSATSTCLEIGQWTFPAPKCLEPCTVPKIPHGKISKKERYYRREVIREISEGTLIEDGSELLLTCEKNYEPLGTANKEEKLNCNLGEWNRFPVCEPAMCRMEPPQTPNASVRKSLFSRHHGSGVVYDCNTYFTKVKYGNVGCHFGTWRGNIPHCKDTRCDVNALAFFSIKTTTKRYYRSKETLIPHCETGYSNIDSKSTITCINGDWKGLDPLPCTPANCSEIPPEIANGYISKFSIHHTSEVSYTCDEFFILKDTESKIRCQFGKWIGEKPKCQDTRCYASNLKKYGSISPDTESTSNSGDILEIHCAVGYSSTGVGPKCVNGEWENDRELCKEDDCKSYRIDHGHFTKRVFKQKCNFFNTNCKRWTEFEQVGNHQVFSTRSSIYVSCDDGYTHHGVRYKNNVDTKCSEGQWKPNPVCLRTGTTYYEVTTTPNSYLAAKKNIIRTSTTKATARTTEKPATTTPSARDTSLEIVGRRANCSCTYQNSDDLLAAFSGIERLKTSALIKDGCKIRFHCSPVGYYRLKGPSEITCRDCRTWHSSEYPQCDMPKFGDTVLIFEGAYTELPGGEIGVFSGSNMHVTCIPQAVREYPKWITFPRSDKNTYYDHVLQDQGIVLPAQVLDISNIGPEQSGLYECSSRGYKPNSFTLKVVDPAIACPIFRDDDYFIVHYDNGQSLNSNALFSCKDPKQKILGPRTLTCLPGGQWSGDPPQCLKLCPELQETEGMVIIYNGDRKTGSTANFNCILPRTLVGVSITACKRNGEWADPIPVCQMPSCKLEDLYNVLPEYLVHDVDSVEGDFVPYNVSIGLKCEDNMRLIGSPNTAKCKHEGKWEIGKVQCVIGCPPVEKIPDSEVVIDPEEEFYRIGQLVTFSCVPGQKLTTEIERIMCLPHGWSQKVSPTCVVIPTDDYVDDQGTATTEEIELTSVEKV